MLKNEDIAKIQELKGKFKNSWLRAEYLQDHLNILGFNKIKNKCSGCKQAGVSFENLISTLLVLPVIGITSIYELTTNKDKELSICGKDSYYRILANQKINWRLFLSEFVKRYLSKEACFTSSEGATKCLIFEDTDLSKTGKTIERIAKVYNHISKKYFLGFKLFVAGYWNGSVFIPIAFSLHRESKKSKLKYGLPPQSNVRLKKQQ